MTDCMMDLPAFSEKTLDVDLLREMMLRERLTLADRASRQLVQTFDTFKPQLR